MSSSSSRTFAQHVHVSSTEELSYTASGSSEMNETIHTIVTGRKCWKTMKGKGEVVWPPYLEAVLVEGLEKYRPVESRTARAFGRFPMRNKFISDYIYNRTGKRRTPKQVGSRLQQLRDTTEGKRILQLLSSRHMALMQPAKSEPQPDALPGQSSSAAESAPAGPPCNHVYIDVALDTGVPTNNAYSHGLSPLSASSADPSFQSSGARPLRAIDPTVTFMSRTLLHAHARSAFRVYVRDSERVVYTEKTELSLRSSSCLPSPGFAQMECSYLYSTAFVPGYWDRLCNSHDPSAYVVVQDIVRAGSPAHPSSSPAPAPQSADDVLLSVIYHFRLSSASSPPHSPTPSAGGIDADSLSFSSESSPELGSEFGDLLMYNGSLDSAPAASVSTAGAGRGAGGSPPRVTYATLDAHSTPGLIHRDEDGYASLPPSPLDLSFAASVQDVASVPMPVPPAPAQMCGNYMGYGSAPIVYDGGHGQMPHYVNTFDGSFHA